MSAPRSGAAGTKTKTRPIEEKKRNRRDKIEKRIDRVKKQAYAGTRRKGVPRKKESVEGYRSTS